MSPRPLDRGVVGAARPGPDAGAGRVPTAKGGAGIEAKVARRWRRAVGVVVVGYLGVLAVNRSLVVVRGPSMEPALWPGDLLVTVPAVGWRLRAGQVVVVRDPADPGHLVVKRLVDVDATGVDVRGDAPDRSTDSRQWGRLPRSSVRRVALARWPDVRSPLAR